MSRFSAGPLVFVLLCYPLFKKKFGNSPSQTIPHAAARKSFPGVAINTNSAVTDCLKVIKLTVFKLLELNRISRSGLCRCLLE